MKFLFPVSFLVLGCFLGQMSIAADATADVGLNVIAPLENLAGTPLTMAQKAEVLHVVQVLQEKQHSLRTSEFASGTSHDYFICIHASASMLVEGTLLLCHNLISQANLAILGETIVPLGKNPSSARFDWGGAVGVDGLVVERPTTELVDGGYKCDQIGTAAGWLGARLAWCGTADQSKKLILLGYQAGSLSEFGGINIKLMAL